MGHTKRVVVVVVSQLSFFVFLFFVCGFLFLFVCLFFYPRSIFVCFFTHVVIRRKIEYTSFCVAVFVMTEHEAQKSLTFDI